MQNYIRKSKTETEKQRNRQKNTHTHTHTQGRTDRERHRALVWKRGRRVAANLNLQDAVVCVVSTHPKVLRELFLLRILAQNSEREKEIEKRETQTSKERDRDRERESQWFWGRRIAALDSSRCGVLFFWEVAWPGKL